jgi:uncharacterized protein (DUF1015 family)
MAKLFPFQGILPSPDFTERVISKPYDKYSKSEVEEIVKQNPASFLNIIKPELANGQSTKPDNPEAQLKSRQKFEHFLENHILTKASNKRYYIYRQVKSDFTYTGIIATISSDDYHNGVIKIHEQTLAPKEEKLKDYLRVVGINAEPVMFTYPHRQEIDELVNMLTRETAYASFHFDSKEHVLWEISNPSHIELIRMAFEGVESVYVADGHHRSASSVLLAQELAKETDDFSGNADWSRFLGIFFPDHNLQLFEFNRLVKDIGSLSLAEILEMLSADFEITLINQTNYKPQMIHEISMYIAGNWYSLKLKHDLQNIRLEDKLDANILSQHILSPLFNITDLRNDERIGFLSGLQGSDELKRLVDTGKYAAAFGLFPVSMEQFFSCSDQGKIMPPKTTWFEPKLLNGLVIYDIGQR